ncbi:sigma-70 family RNA polymerase sigma factor [Phycicoccus sp. SLBN-51]|jgi:RNA polymerase sigma factor (sigma-70 family)|uniref:RNA polymerase sigma factor n=1 Tax=Phycicoccus sp. SLBN-51 TaxID=2768447 RepID=UPI00114F601B|nr:sigma-70 family RNA polymerase sigma factor [Phycicoccus sp. SLBN-51]TQJ48967.1 RNA polymerase sigma factor (sigma-70 family) [Phycicoccus sp. SLBN-51]
MGVTLPAFQTLVDAHWRDVARLAHALAGPVDGDDVAQQAWTQALAAYPRLQSSRNLRSWLLTITHRCAMDVHRSRGRRAVPSDTVSELAEHTVAAGPEAGLPDTDLWQRVADLPERQRHAVVLKFVADLDHAAIAQALETTPTMSRRLVSDGLAALRKELS